MREVFVLVVYVFGEVWLVQVQQKQNNVFKRRLPPSIRASFLKTSREQWIENRPEGRGYFVHTNSFHKADLTCPKCPRYTKLIFEQNMQQRTRCLKNIVSNFGKDLSVCTSQEKENTTSGSGVTEYYCLTHVCQLQNHVSLQDGCVHCWRLQALSCVVNRCVEFSSCDNRTQLLDKFAPLLPAEGEGTSTGSPGERRRFQVPVGADPH